MSGQDRFSWFSGLQQQTRCRKSAPNAPGRGFAQGRRLHVETLEDRRMLAVITVDSLLDNAFPDGGITLREAILAANTNTAVGDAPAGDVGADTIEFAAALSGQTINLAAELQITEALTIDARALAANVTIDANNASRIFNITATTGDFTLAGLTLTGGRTTGNNGFSDNTFSGGAIRSLTTGSLTIDQSTVSGNSTAGIRADGGGIFSLHTVTLTGSTVSGNSIASSDADGGGVYSYGSVTLTNSTVSGNSTAGNNSDGSGIFSKGNVTLSNSTVSDNRATHSSAAGGGIFNSNNTITITNSIGAGNMAGGGSPDIRPGTSTLSVNYSLLGTAVTPDAGGSGNLFSDTPLLGPLASNGGPTETHALLAGSLAIEAGDPGFNVGATPNDQRGAPFLRGVGTRVDIGAYERQTVASLNLTVDTNVDENDGDYSAGDLSLREAIGLATVASAPRQLRSTQHFLATRSLSAAHTCKSPRHSPLMPWRSRKTSPSTPTGSRESSTSPPPPAILRSPG